MAEYVAEQGLHTAAARISLVGSRRERTHGHALASYAGGYDFRFGGRGQIVGSVKEKNTPTDTPLRRRVRLFRERDGRLIRETWSDAVTGSYRFDHIDETQIYTVVSYDYLHNYRAVIADGLTPELMP